MKAAVGIMFGGKQDSPTDDFDVDLPTGLTIAPLVECSEFAIYVCLREPPPGWDPTINQLHLGMGFWVNDEKIPPAAMESEEVDGDPIFFAWFKRGLKPGDTFRIHLKPMLTPKQAKGWN